MTGTEERMESEMNEPIVRVRKIKECKVGGTGPNGHTNHYVLNLGPVV